MIVKQSAIAWKLLRLQRRAALAHFFARVGKLDLADRSSVGMRGIGVGLSVSARVHCRAQTILWIRL